MKKHLWGMICLILILALTGCQSGGQASGGSAGESTAAETGSLIGQNGGGEKFQEFLGEDEEVYRALTEGIQGQAESVPASADQAKNDFMAAWIQVSPYGALIQDIRVENGTFVLSYAYEKETQDAYLVRLQEDLKKCKETLPDSANEWETAMAVYRYYASRFAPASAWNQAELPDGIPLLLALESGEGTSLSYTQGCQFALNELGVDAFLLKNGGGSEEIRWCLAARLGDSYYYLNPALENGSDDGQGLQYFGGSEAREPISYEPAVGGPYLPWGEQASGSENVCSDERFDFMKNIISWSFEESAAHTVRLVDLDGKERTKEAAMIRKTWILSAACSIWRPSIMGICSPESAMRRREAYRFRKLRSVRFIPHALAAAGNSRRLRERADLPMTLPQGSTRCLCRIWGMDGFMWKVLRSRTAAFRF